MQLASRFASRSPVLRADYPLSDDQIRTVAPSIFAGRDSLKDSVNQAGQEMTRRNMNMQPTLTERPGLPMRVIVNRDLVLRPYQPMFFQRGSSR